MGEEYTELDFNQFKINVDRLYKKLTYPNLREIILKQDAKVIEYRESVNKMIEKISYFGPLVKSKDDLKWLYGIKKAFEIRKFILTDYYDLLSYRKKNDIALFNGVEQEILIGYYKLIKKAVERLGVLESYGLTDFSNVSDLVKIKIGLLKEKSNVNKVILTELVRLEDKINEEDNFSKLRLYLECLTDDDLPNDKLTKILRLWIRKLSRTGE